MYGSESQNIYENYSLPNPQLFGDNKYDKFPETWHTSFKENYEHNFSEIIFIIIEKIIQQILFYLTDF